jgi:hypothetical protein
LLLLRRPAAVVPKRMAGKMPGAEDEVEEAVSAKISST